MKKILTFVFLLLLLKAGAQTSVTAVSTCGPTWYVRVTFTDEFVPLHNTSPVTCPDGTTHYNTEESQYLNCKMELFADAACSIPMAVDPRFFAYCNCITASHGTRIQPDFLNLPDCSAGLPAGSEYGDNWRTDRYLVTMTECTWECLGGGFYNCAASGPGVPTTYDIVVNCCFEPKPLAVHLVSFDGVRGSGVNTISWVLSGPADLARLEMERSFDGIRYDLIYSTTDVTVSTFSDVVDISAYYRLKLYNTNGTFFYSAVVEVKVGDFGRAFSVSFLGDDLKVAVTSPVKSRSVFKFCSVDGRTVFIASRDLKAGVNHLVFIVPRVCKGVYVLTMSNEEGVVARNVLKQ